MCQTSVFIDKDGKEELLFENVTTLEVVDNGLRIATLFEGSRDLAGAVIKSIDFDGGKVHLLQNE